MKTMNDPAKDAYFEPACYASRIAALISEHQSKDERPDWWQQVVAQLHSQLDKQFPQFEVEFEELTATDVIPPWKGGSAPAEQPDFLRLQKMAPCQESAAALVTVATAATDKRADAICKQAELLQNLLASTKALLLNVDARLEALESRFGRMDFYCEAHSDHHEAISKRLEALEMKAPG